jgi:hypothetical protein
MLCHRHIEGLRQWRGRRTLTYIADHADNGPPFRFHILTAHDLLANGILAGKHLLRQFAADDEDHGGVFIVLLSEHAAMQ